MKISPSGIITSLALAIFVYYNSNPIESIDVLINWIMIVFCLIAGYIWGNVIEASIKFRHRN